MIHSVLMKIFALIYCILSFQAAYADSAQVQYYVGEAVTTNMNTGAVTRAPYIDERTTDSNAGTITEKVVTKQGSGFVENTAVLKVSGNHFSMTESTGTVTGQGDLTGTAWNWTFLRGEFSMMMPAFKMRIVDYNFFADPNSIEGHKDFYLTVMAPNAPNAERLTQQEDVILHLVDQATFTAKRAALLTH